MTAPPDNGAEAAVLDLFERDAADGTPLTTSEVATGVDCSRRTAYNRLQRLAAGGRLETKKVGAKGRVWWLPAPSDGRTGGASRLDDRFSIPSTETVLQIFESSPVGIAIVDSSRVVVFANDRLGAVLGRPEEPFLDRSSRTLFEHAHDDVGRSLSRDTSPVAAVFETGTAVTSAPHELRNPDGTSKPVSVDAVPITRPDGTVEGVGLAVMDLSEAHRREADLQSQRTELMRLNRVNSVIRGVSRAVTSAQSQSALDRAVCTQIAESDLYLFALVGEFSAAYTEFTVRASAGVGEGYLEAMLDNPATPPLDDGPGATAAKTGEVQVVQNLTDLPYEYWQEAAEELQFRSYASIPLVHRDVVYGVLGVYARQPVAFDRDERELLAELGEMVGHGLHALDAARQLESDQHVELTFGSAHLAETYHDLGADVQLTVEGTIPLDDGTQLQYWTISGVEPGRYVHAVGDRPTVLGVDLVKRVGDRSRIEVHTSAASLSATFRSFDGRLTAANLDDEALRLVARFPVSVDVDALLAAVRTVYPDLTLEDRRLVYTPRLLTELAEEHLTGRQWTTVQRAYYAGYFEQPRRRTGTELAEQMDVTTTTFHRHLRNAEAEIFRVLFEIPPGER